MRKSSTLYIKISVLLELILILICIFQSIIHDVHPNVGSIKDAVDMTEGWYDKDGNEVVLEPLLSNKSVKFGKTTSIYYDLTEDIKPGMSMCFRSLSTNFKAYIDDKLIIAPTYYKSPFSCKSTGSQWHFYTFTEEDMGKTIEVKLKFFYNDTANYFENVLACNSHDYILNAITARLGEIIIALFILAIGLFITIVGIYSKYNLNLNKHVLVTLGLFSITLSTWTLLESHIIELLFNCSQLVQIMACNMLFLLPITILQFFRYVFNQKYHPIINYTSLLDTVIFILAWILQITGIQDFHDTLYLAFISIISAGLMCVIIVLIENKDILKTKSANTLNYNGPQANYMKLTLFVVFLLCLLIDFVNFYINPQKINGLLSRASSIFAIALCIIIAVRNIVSISEEFNHATAINKVAYNDVLTGLFNRTAYKEKIEQLNSNSNPNSFIGFVMFDVNNLKYVNDNLGHNYGDELIISASQIIKETFNDESITLFRLGGDEFIAIIESANAREMYKIASLQFKTNIHNFNNFYNKKYHLAIAHGASFYSANSKKTISQIIEEADHLMYENKQEYKKTHPVQPL